MKRVYTLKIFLLGFFIVMYSSLVSPQDSMVWMRQGDAFWQEREKVEKVEAAISAYRKILEADPDNYEANWKIARAYFHLGDMLDEINENREQHRKVGKEGMRYGERATDLNPSGIEGHYYYGLCLAKYTLGISFITALTEGLASKYEKHMERAIEINKNYDSAGPLRALGKYWYEIPWPKRDLTKSIECLKEAVTAAPMNIRGHFYLAESYLKVGERELAKEQLEIAAALPIDLKEEISAQRWQQKAKLLLQKKF